jgi:hypothetical protein
MQTVIYAATRFGYCVQVVDRSGVVYEYFAGNCQKESSAVIAPDSPGAVKLAQLKRWARQTAGEIAGERGIPATRIEYDPDLEATLKDQDAQRGKS